MNTYQSLTHPAPPSIRSQAQSISCCVAANNPRRAQRRPRAPILFPPHRKLGSPARAGPAKGKPPQSFSRRVVDWDPQRPVKHQNGTRPARGGMRLRPRRNEEEASPANPFPVVSSTGIPSARRTSEGPAPPRSRPLRGAGARTSCASPGTRTRCASPTPHLRRLAPSKCAPPRPVEHQTSPEG